MKRRLLPDFNGEKLQAYNFDVLVIGTGVAGLYAALNLDDDLEVGVVTKSNIDESNSYLAQGGIAAVMTSDDNFENHIEDTLVAGAGLCNVEAVKVLCEEGPADIRRLIEMQVPFDVNEDGDLQITREGGHHHRRIVHCGGDATGRETTKQLGKIALKKENLHFFFDTYLVDIITKNNVVFGALVHTGDEYKLLRSNNIIVAAGGCGQIYRYTTSPLGSVGDGIAACARAGAKVNDMELVQFHPTTLVSEGKEDRLFLISEAVRGEGGILRNSKGEAFMKGKHELADLAPRDIVTREILKELDRVGDKNAWLDVSSMSEEFFSTRFPTIYGECKSRGINVPHDMIPVHPAQHYLMGGVKTDTNAKTNIKGLYCCGECAETGIHGANRLASNSLLECLVFGRRAAEDINKNLIPLADEINSYTITSEKHTKRLGLEEFQAIESKVKDTMSTYVGPVRHPSGLRKAKEILTEISNKMDEIILETPYEFKVFNGVANAIMIVDGAIARKESVGSHYIVND